jgi:hypothetical protein
MNIIYHLPYYLQRALEASGLEEEVSRKESNLYIEFPDFDMAYSFREHLKQYDIEFQFLTHPVTGKPVLELFNVLPNV